MRHFVRACIIGMSLTFSGCQLLWGPTPGESTKDRDLMRDAEPIISAVENFRKAHGYYPKSLNELVPRYIAGRSTFAPFRYGVWKGEYSLEFSYVTGMPGFQSITQCVYDSKNRKWKCGGYI